MHHPTVMRRIFLLGVFLSTGYALADTADDPNMTGKRELQMLQCPSAAPGATTHVRPTHDGVELVVTAPTEFGRSEIRRRAALQKTRATQPSRGHEEHTGRGTGSALYGYCPGMMTDTKWTVFDTETGARIVIVATHRDQVAELQRTTQARAKRLLRSSQAAKR